MNPLINHIKFNFLYVDKYSFGRTWVYPENKIPYNMLRYVCEGSAEFCIDGVSYLLEKDQIAYIPEGCSLYCRALEDNFSFISIRFSTSVYYEGANFLTEYFYLSNKVEGDAIIREYFYHVYNSVFSESVSKMFYVSGYLELIIARVLDKCSGNTETAMKKRESGDFSFEDMKRRAKKITIKEDSRIRAVIDYITEHPSENYQAKRLCHMADMAETTFRRLFKQHTGKTAVDYIRELRLTTAARKILITTTPISDIAYELGYDDPNYFIRIFKKNYGMTPRQYRDSIKE